MNYFDGLSLAILFLNVWILFGMGMVLKLHAKAMREHQEFLKDYMEIRNEH